MPEKKKTLVSIFCHEIFQICRFMFYLKTATPPSPEKDHLLFPSKPL